MKPGARLLTRDSREGVRWEKAGRKGAQAFRDNNL